MRGYLLSFFSLGGLFLFSFCLFIGDSLSFFWLYLELSTLCLIPSFFLYSNSKVFGSLFNYIIVSGVSSSLLVCGILFEKLLFLSLLGLLIKFGFFPFMGWVYNVVIWSNWLVVWGFSTLSKVPFFFLPFFLSGAEYSAVFFLSIITFLLLSGFFWLYSYSWLHCWGHMMLSSSIVLFVISGKQSLDVLVCVFLVYFIWSSLVILFLRTCFGLELFGLVSYFLFVSLFISFPFSFSIFYKFVVGFSMFSCPLLVFCCWVFYSVSEQAYLLSCLVIGNLPRFVWSSLSLV